MSVKNAFFVTGIGTEVGKTVASALLVDDLQADYWKPVQSGDLQHTDSDKIREWARVKHIHPERFRLHTPASPHYAAAVDGTHISLSDFSLPATENHLIVEGAGGLLVPLNEQECMLDLIEHLGLAVIVVANYYLGSINHSLMTISVLEQRNIPIDRLIFMGKATPSSREVIVKMTQHIVPYFVDIPDLGTVNAASIQAKSHLVKDKK